MQLSVNNRNLYNQILYGYKYDAFGNALGNSIVSKINQPPQMSEAEKKGRAKLAAAMQGISDDTDVMTDARIAEIAQQNCQERTKGHCRGNTIFAMNENLHKAPTLNSNSSSKQADDRKQAYMRFIYHYNITDFSFPFLFFIFLQFTPMTFIFRVCRKRIFAAAAVQMTL